MGNQPFGEPEAIYRYHNEQGTVLFEVVRYRDKRFRQRHPHPTIAGETVWNLRGVRRVPYRLPELIAGVARGETVYVVEGEKDVDATCEAGGVATCNPGGAGKWRPGFATFLAGAEVVVVADNDPPGIEHARMVLASLLGVASAVRIVLAAEGKDAADHLAAGKSLAEFVPFDPTSRDELELTDLTVDDILAARPPASPRDLLAQNPGLKALLRGSGSAATVLVRLAHEAGVGLFHTPDRRAFACLSVSGQEETLLVRSRGFGLSLRHLFHRDREAAPSREAVASAVATLEGEALFDGPCLPVHIRIAGDADVIYIDLGDTDWRTVTVTKDGWSLTDTCPARFYRTPSMAAMPEPVRGGSVAELRRFVNLSDDADWRLAVAWLVTALRPTGPYPVLGLQGEQGSAKTTTARGFRELVDPSTVPVRAAPKDERDLMIAATNGWVINLDNLSRLPAWLSDAICRLATGGGFATRELYTDADEVLFNATRPVIVNGIEELATRSDLLDRAILLDLPTIDPRRRRTENEFWPEFGEARPRILGAILGAVSHAIGHVHEVSPDSLPRMADFAQWATAAEPSHDTPGGFIGAYTHNRAKGHELAVDSAVIGRSLLQVAGNGFEGTASELLELLAQTADEQSTRQREWPKTGRAMSAALRRLAPNLRALGYPVEFDRESTRERRRIVRLGPACVRTVHTDQPRDHQPGGVDARGRKSPPADTNALRPLPEGNGDPDVSDDLDANLNVMLRAASERASHLGYPELEISPERRIPSGPGALTSLLRAIHEKARGGDSTARRDLAAVLDALDRLTSEDGRSA